MRKAIELRLYGPVQGVGFRYHVRSGAVALGVSGWVRNHPDGGVQIRAEGGEDELRRFLDYLDGESSYARIDRRQVEEVSPDGLTSFEIRY